MTTNFHYFAVVKLSIIKLFLGLDFIVIFDNYWFHCHFSSRADANLSSPRYLVATDKAIKKIILELLLVSCNQIVSTKAWVMSRFEIPPS